MNAGTFWAAELIFSIELLLFNGGKSAKELALREVLTYFRPVKQCSLNDIWKCTWSIIETGGKHKRCFSWRFSVHDGISFSRHGLSASRHACKFLKLIVAIRITETVKSGFSTWFLSLFVAISCFFNNLSPVVAGSFALSVDERVNVESATTSSLPALGADILQGMNQQVLLISRGKKPFLASIASG